MLSLVQNLFFKKKNPLQDLPSSLNAVISSNERHLIITDHVIFKLPYNQIYQMKSTNDQLYQTWSIIWSCIICRHWPSEDAKKRICRDFSRLELSIWGKKCKRAKNLLSNTTSKRDRKTQYLNSPLLLIKMSRAFALLLSSSCLMATIRLSDKGGFNLHLLIFPFVYQFTSRIGVLVNSSIAND